MSLCLLISELDFRGAFNNIQKRGYPFIIYIKVTLLKDFFKKRIALVLIYQSIVYIISFLR